MVQRGEIDRKAARTHEKKNVITRAIGGYDTVEAEMFSVDLKKEDMILMCSDGLTNMLSLPTLSLALLTSLSAASLISWLLFII